MKALLPLVALSLLHHPVLLFSSLSLLFFFPFPPVPSFLVESHFAPVPGSFLRLAPSHFNPSLVQTQLLVLPLPPPQKNAAFYSISRTTAYHLVIIQTASLTFTTRLYRYVLHSDSHRLCFDSVVARGYCARPLKLSPWSHSKSINPFLYRDRGGLTRFLDQNKELSQWPF